MHVTLANLKSSLAREETSGLTRDDVKRVCKIAFEKCEVEKGDDSIDTYIDLMKIAGMLK